MAYNRRVKNISPQERKDWFSKLDSFTRAKIKLIADEFRAANIEWGDEDGVDRKPKRTGRS